MILGSFVHDIAVRVGIKPGFYSIDRPGRVILGKPGFYWVLLGNTG